MSKRRAIGIDLGTTYSCVGCWNGTSVDIIANDMGNRTTPSYVAFTDSERLIGDAAKSQSASNAANTVFDAKRLLGRKYSDPITQNDIEHFPFKVVDDGSDKPEIEVTYKGELKRLKPEEISAAVLTKMKTIAEAFLGETVTDAVITVPAYFNDAQRQSTKDAGFIAGLNILRIINEPTAAAMAYHLEKGGDKDKIVLIYDLGGGTFDVSLLSIGAADSIIEVLATAGDTHLGGEDFDELLVQHFITEFNAKSGININGNSRALRRLRTACESAKRTLSSSNSADINIDSLAEGVDFNSKITRAKFEDLCMHLFKKCMEPVEMVLRDAKVSKSQVDEIVLVGGSTRIPKVQELLSEAFNGKQLNKSINPDEAVAYGATLLAAQLNQEDMGSVDILVCDVTPLSIGIANDGVKMEVLVPRATTIPVTKSKEFSNSYDNQTAVEVRVYEGERKFVKDNNLIGTFMLTDIPPMPRGQCKIDISIDIDANSIVNVTAVETSTGKSQKITIANEKNRLSKADIDRMVEEAEKFKKDDEEASEIFKSKSDLESFIYNWKKTLGEEKIKEKLSEEELKSLNDNLVATENWLMEHSSDKSKDLYMDKLKELEQLVLPLGQKLYGSEGSMPMQGIPNMSNVGGMPDLNNMSMEDLQKMMEQMKGMKGMEGLNMNNIPENENENEIESDSSGELDEQLDENLMQKNEETEQ